MVVFLSNFYTHHQIPFSREMYKALNGQFRFIETVEMDEERKNMGWEVDNDPFVLQYANDKEHCTDLIDSAEVVIYGSAPYALLKKRLSKRKLTICYSERIYKQEPPLWEMPLRAARYFWKWGRFKNVFLLCASAYTASDYARTGTFLNRTYKWGYFPEEKRYDNIEGIIELKRPLSILWVARLIELKHPELPVLVAKRLRDEGYAFSMNLVGNGVMQSQIETMIKDFHLQNHVFMLGAMTPEEVRKKMEESSIFMFTSDRNEGWGAVLNESMNSGCAVIASSAIGSVPFLIEHEKNGLIYEDGSFESLYKATKTLLDNPQQCVCYGIEAYKSITELWNADVAARRVLALISDLQKTGESIRFESGPCSKAKIVNGWFKQ